MAMEGLEYEEAQGPQGHEAELKRFYLEAAKSMASFVHAANDLGLQTTVNTIFNDSHISLKLTDTDKKSFYVNWNVRETWRGAEIDIVPNRADRSQDNVDKLYAAHFKNASEIDVPAVLQEALAKFRETSSADRESGQAQAEAPLDPQEVEMNKCMANFVRAVAERDMKFNISPSSANDGINMCFTTLAGDDLFLHFRKQDDGQVA